jgi:hypothetical protein
VGYAERLCSETAAVEVFNFSFEIFALSDDFLRTDKTPKSGVFVIWTAL